MYLEALKQIVGQKENVVQKDNSGDVSDDDDVLDNVVDINSDTDDMNDNDIQKKLDELIKNSDLFIASPNTIEQLLTKGLPIKSVFTTYKEYLDGLFTKKRQFANELIEKLPHLDESIANSSVTSLYEELKECFVMGIHGASITMAIILFDFAAKFRLHKERQKKNPNASWKPIEDLLLKEVIIELREHEAITEEEKLELLGFNKKIRNNYLHYNIQKLVKDMILSELPSVNVNTGEVTIQRDVKPAERPYLWFSAKKVLDKETVVDRVTFCVGWVNKFLE